MLRIIVRFLLLRTDPDAQRMVAEFQKNGIASLTANGMHYGLIRQVGEERGKILIVADVTEPELMESIKERLGDEELFGIELDPERGEEI